MKRFILIILAFIGVLALVSISHAATMARSISAIKPAQAMGTAFQTDLKDNAELFSTASASLGKDIAESIAKGVKENLSNVRYEIAAAIAPSVANILSMGGGVRAQP